MRLRVRACVRACVVRAVNYLLWQSGSEAEFKRVLSIVKSDPLYRLQDDEKALLRKYRV